MNKMKKILILIVLAVIPLTAGTASQKKAVPQDKLFNIISEYSRKGNFEVTRVGRLGTTALKGLIRMTGAAEGDNDVREMLSIVSGINRIAVVEYGDSEDKLRKEFQNKVESVLSGVDILMEVKDESDKFKVYGVVSDKSDSVRDFVLYSPGDCTLVCLFGSIPLEKVAEIVNR